MFEHPYASIIGLVIVVLLVAIYLRKRADDREHREHHVFTPLDAHHSTSSIAPQSAPAPPPRKGEDLAERLRRVTTVKEVLAVYYAAPVDSQVERDAKQKAETLLRVKLDAATSIDDIIEIIEQASEPCPALLSPAVTKAVGLATDTDDCVGVYNVLDDSEDALRKLVAKRALELAKGDEDFTQLADNVDEDDVSPDEILASRAVVLRVDLDNAKDVDDCVEIIGAGVPAMIEPGVTKALAFATSTDEALAVYEALDVEDDEHTPHLRAAATRALELAQDDADCDTVSNTVTDDEEILPYSAILERRVELADTPEACLSLALDEEVTLDLDDSGVQKAVLKAADLIRAAQTT